MRAQTHGAASRPPRVPIDCAVRSVRALLLVQRQKSSELLLELLLQGLELAQRVLRTCLLRRTELAARDLRPDPLLCRLDRTDPGSERLGGVRETLADRAVVTCLRLRLRVRRDGGTGAGESREKTRDERDDESMTMIRLPSYDFGGIPRLGLSNGCVSDVRAGCKALAGGC